MLTTYEKIPIYKSIGYAIAGSFERVFKRYVWLEKKSFELGSLVNYYLGFNSNSDIETRLKKLELLKEKTAKVLKHYKLKPYKMFKKLNFHVNDVKRLLDDVCKACSIIHMELLRINSSYQRQQRLRRLLQSLKKAPD